MLALLLAACGGGGSDGGRIDAAASDLATADLAVASDLAGVDLGGVDLAGADLATPLDLAWVAPIDLGPPPDGFGAYPAGPYGSTAGAVVPDFTFQGYFSGLATSGLSSSQPFAAASFDTARTSGARALLVMFAGFTWTACQNSARVLAQNAPTVAPKGGLIWGILVEGTPSSSGYLPATQSQLQAWITSASAPNTWSLDSVAPQPTMESYFSVGRDTYVLIDLSTMKIAKIDYDVTTALSDFNGMLP